MTNVPGVDYDVCYNYPDGEIYYRDDITYEDCECYFNTYDENHPNYDPNYPGINEDDSCKDKIGLFQGTYYDEVDTYRPKWISVMWCCFLDYGKINVEGFAIGSITNQFNGSLGAIKFPDKSCTCHEYVVIASSSGLLKVATNWFSNSVCSTPSIYHDNLSLFVSNTPFTSNVTY